MTRFAVISAVLLIGVFNFGAVQSSEPEGLCCLEVLPEAQIAETKPPMAQKSGHLPVLDFNGLEQSEPVEDFYAGGLGGDGSGPGPDFGISFSSNGLALISQEAGGSGNFTNNPAGDTILFFLTGTETVMNVPGGFEQGFSFFYSAANQGGFIRVYDQEGGQGTLLAELNLPQTPRTGNTPYTYDNWQEAGVSFSGVARSVDFGGTADQIGFDLVTLGSSTAGGGPGGPGGPSGPVTVPVGGGGWLLLSILGGLLIAPFALRRRA